MSDKTHFSLPWTGGLAAAEPAALTAVLAPWSTQIALGATERSPPWQRNKRFLGSVGGWANPEFAKRGLYLLWLLDAVGTNDLSSFRSGTIKNRTEGGSYWFYSSFMTCTATAVSGLCRVTAEAF
jgi:hypothetical protein